MQLVFIQDPKGPIAVVNQGGQLFYFASGTAPKDAFNVFASTVAVTHLDPNPNGSFPPFPPTPVAGQLPTTVVNSSDGKWIVPPGFKVIQQGNLLKNHLFIAFYFWLRPVNGTPRPVCEQSEVSIFEPRL